MQRLLLGFALFLAILVAFAFLVLPVVAIFTHVAPGTLVDQLSNPVVHDAVIVTLKTTLVAQAAILLFGTPTAWFLATRRFPGRSALVTLVELPFVLPPAVAGIGLLVAFGRVGLLGSTFEFLHIDIAFSWVAVVLAITLVASPLYVRQAIAAFEAVDPNLVAASRTLGAGPVRTFFRVALPLARGGLAAGEADDVAAEGTAGGATGTAAAANCSANGSVRPRDRRSLRAATTSTPRSRRWRAGIVAGEARSRGSSSGRCCP